MVAKVVPIVPGLPLAVRRFIYHFQHEQLDRRDPERDGDG